MNTQLHIPANSPAPQAAASATQMYVQRKCACGGTAGLTGGCEGCEKEKLVQRRAIESAPSGIPPLGHEVLASAGQPLDAKTHSFMEPRFGHDFSRVKVFGEGAVLFQGTPKGDGKTGPKPTTKADKKNKKKAAKITTPDGVDLGPTDEAKTFCLKSNSFDVKTAVASNTVGVATGQQVIKFEGENTGKKDKKDCSCDCGVYRHWISGFMQVITPMQIQKIGTDMAIEFQKAGAKAPPTAQEVLARALATTPKLHNLASCQHALTIQEGTYTEEYTKCIGDNDPDSCKWRYTDGPGATGGLSDGIYIRVNHPFQYEIWDACQGKSVETKQATLSIEGDKAPRTISWS